MSNGFLVNHNLPKTDKEFNIFLTKLNSQLVRPPILHKGEENMSEISLRLIFNEVQKKGGFYAVDRYKQWFNIFRLVHLNCKDIKKHTSASNMLKRNYKKYLLVLEERQRHLRDIRVTDDEQKRNHLGLTKYNILKMVNKTSSKEFSISLKEDNFLKSESTSDHDFDFFLENKHKLKNNYKTVQKNKRKQSSNYKKMYTTKKIIDKRLILPFRNKKDFSILKHDIKSILSNEFSTQFNSKKEIKKLIFFRNVIKEKRMNLKSFSLSNLIRVIFFNMMYRKLFFDHF